jgi:HK97 family phage portal protein
MGLIDTFFGKAINKRVQTLTTSFLTQASTNLFNDSVFRWLNNGMPVMKEDRETYVNAYNTVGAVMECVDIITKKVVACPRIVYKIKDQKEYKKFLNYSKSAETLGKALVAKAKAMEEVHMPEIEKLLNNPNKQQNGDDFIETITGLFLLTGNAYIYGNSSLPRNKKWSEVYALPTDMTIVTGGPMEPIKGYRVNCWDTNISDFPADQIKHFKTFNPNYSTTGQQLYGMSTLRPYLYSLDILQNADRQADKQVKNGGIFGLLMPENKEDNLSDDQNKDLKEGLQSARRSDDELARMVPVSIAMKWQQIGLPSGDLQLIELSGAKADDIYRGYHIPLQFRNQDSATYNNLPVANRKFIFDAVAPICRKEEVGLTEFYCAPYNTDKEQYVIHLDFMSLPELNSDMVAAVSWLQNSPMLTPNEKREVIGYGRSEEPGMDSILINRNTVFMADVLAGKVDQTQNSQSGSNAVD